ncbi:MAG: FecR domain-containing protein [Bacteroidota bacterium]
MNWKEDETFLAKWLNGELSNKQKMAFDKTAEGKEFGDLIKAVEQIELPGLDVDKGFDNLQSRIDDHKEKRGVIQMKPSYWVSVAASVSIIAILFYLFPPNTIVETAYAEQKKVTLPSGSRVHMNVASKLSYSRKNWDEKRILEFEGEGFFEVEKGAHFTVKTANGNISVLGTSFNVKSRKESLKVGCYSGKVEVTVAQQTQQLSPGQITQFRNDHLIELKEATLQKVPSWTSGIIKLESAPFADVLDELSYVFDIEIAYNGSFIDLIYTGSFPNDDVETAIALVFEPLNVDYQYDSTSKTLKVFVN